MLSVEFFRSQLIHEHIPHTAPVRAAGIELHLDGSILVGLRLAVVVERVLIIIVIEDTYLQSVFSEAEDIECSALHGHPGVGAEHVDVDGDGLVLLVDGECTVLVSDYTTIVDAVDEDRAILLELHITIVNTIGVANPTIVGTHLPVDVLVGVRLVVGHGAPSVGLAPLCERTFPDMLFAILTVVEIPLGVEQRLVERHVAGHSDRSDGHGLIDGTCGTVAGGRSELIIDSELAVVDIDRTGEVVAVRALFADP